jgi:LysR family transcriptional regulator, transcription activator of glutamate synthase operon
VLVEPLVLAVPVRHRLASRDEVALAEVAADPFVLRSAPSRMREQALELCHAARIEPEIAVVPAQGLPVPTTFARTRLLPLTDDGAHREVRLAWVRDRALLPSTEAFRRFVLTRGDAVPPS